MIKPTIGRVVWYFDETTNVQPNAAMICWVDADTMVNLVVFDEQGNPRSETSVILKQDEGNIPRRHAEWMPYQQGQAAKTEALEKKLEQK
jgi:hypothetical protein